MARLSADGSLYPSFGAGGRVVTDFGLQASPSAILVQPDGKLVAVGLAYQRSAHCCQPSDFALARYNPDGSLDAGFGVGGKVVTDFGQTDEAYAAAGA
jgi:uncharacterized delta-60 repeat protein